MILGGKIKTRIIGRFFKTFSYPKKDAIDALLTEDPFDYSPSWKVRFFEAMRHAFRHHSKNSEFYKRLCGYGEFDSGRLNSFDDIWDIPYILCDAFKAFDIQTKTRDLLRMEMTSSGTSGRKSKVALNILSGQRLLYSAYHIYETLGAVASEPANYIFMAYSPSLDDTRATTNSDIVISYFAPRKEVFYALDSKKGEGVGFLKDETVANLRRFIRDGAPIRILGFLHHTCEVLKAYYERYGRAEFPRGSYILSGGGWKNFARIYGDGFDLFKFLSDHTAIDLKNVRDLYTLNEHAVFYLECEEHNMHVPNVALACSRDPRTLKRLGCGQRGLVHLYSPLIESAPLLSILTTDYGSVGESCPCRIGGPYLKIMGRAGVTKKTTCAATADQYINSTEEAPYV